MKGTIRIFVFCYISLFVAQLIVDGFRFGGNRNVTIFLVLFALTLINVLMSPILSVLSLPYKGPGALIIAFFLNFIVLYMLMVFVPNFSIQESTIAELNILGFVLPSKSLGKMGALIFSSLSFVVFLNFFRWLCSSKKS